VRAHGRRIEYSQFQSIISLHRGSLFFSVISVLSLAHSVSISVLQNFAVIAPFTVVRGRTLQNFFTSLRNGIVSFELPFSQFQRIE
jgi:hypothetical protein